MSNQNEAARPVRQEAQMPPAPTQGDLEVERQLKKNDATLLSDMRTRAEKWAAGLTALTGLVSTALFIKGPEGILDVPEPFRLPVAVLVTAALVALISGTLFIYSAAYGSPRALRTLERTLPGLEIRYEIARAEAGKSALKQLFIAVCLTIAGVGLLFAAAMLTWFVKADSSAEGVDVCIEANGVSVKLGEVQPVDGREELTIIPCP